MKKLILLLTIALFGSVQAYSQGLDLGFKVGYNYTNFDIDNVSAKSRSGLMAGAFVKVKLSETFGIQPEVLLMQRAGQLGYNDPTVTGTGAFTFNYIDVPVMLVFKPIPILNIHFGPYASYLASVSVDNKGVGYDFSEVRKSQFNDWDFGAAAGVGVDVLFLTAGVRYNQGLTKVGNASKGYIFANGRTSVVTVYAGIAF
ncbi:MAG: porin family protein [Bacteroidota bacterium]